MQRGCYWEHRKILLRYWGSLHVSLTSLDHDITLASQHEWNFIMMMIMMIIIQNPYLNIWYCDRLFDVAWLFVLDLQPALGLGLLDDLEERLTQVEEKLNSYAVHIVTDDKRPSRLAERLFHSPSRSECRLLSFSFFMWYDLLFFVCFFLSCWVFLSCWLNICVKILLFYFKWERTWKKQR